MKTLALSLLAFATLAFPACHGPGGPAERTGRSVDHATAAVGHGVKKTGEKIEDAAR